MFERITSEFKNKKIENINKFWLWVKDTFTPDYRKEIEEYLSMSYDNVDLENRIRLIQKRGMI
jgi:hypothetical protein